MRTASRETIIVIIVAVAIFIASQTVVQSFVVIGSSMQPSFINGQRLLVSKVTYRLHEPQRGDVIVFHPPTSQSTDYIKRVIAIPGDTIEVKRGTVYINGYGLDEPYIKTTPHYTLPKQRIGQNEYFVLGDNRNNSSDSHRWGSVPRNDIIGKVWLSIWPPGLIPNYHLEEQLGSAKFPIQLPQTEANYGWSTVGTGIGDSHLFQLAH
ncbi:MAG: signal peptidase I [Dehalococcoidales bacterium]|nr:signal peptidase I [Dehalococcoidales bacterium]